ncbi:beta-galactoside-binding lectin isoform X2 [Oreochromis niloticus]|uniref:beta-galactoside-binding lectin isoform X2 n=1 Tax=Oreochromis niloticus TaxID=8128 RepID=UPI00022B43BD|nr:beta-galactoside-binding lectin isoform X2 [Oreochromis niloticus]CAI5675118.1 unnamed protein product [Mustela putorius furo]
MMNGVFVKNMSFKVGQTMTVVGVTKPEAGDAHGDSNIIVCNSFEGGSWCQEQREQSFPFSLGQEFKISIEFTPSEFVVTLQDGSTFRFPNRVGAEKYSALNFDGDARIQTIDIK